MTFGTRLKKLREEQGLTQQQLGEMSGVSPRVLGYCEQDQRFNTAIIIITKLCETLNTTADYLMFGDENYSTEYKRTNSKSKFINEYEKEYKIEKYTKEELEVINYAKKHGITAKQLVSIIDVINRIIEQQN